MPILPAEPYQFPEDLWDRGEGSSDGPMRWFCLHTKPRQEKAVARDLRAQQIAFYLPLATREDRTPAGRKIRSIIPLFGGYLFLRGTDEDRVEAIRGNRLVRVLDVVDQGELVKDLQQIRRILNSGQAIEPEPSAPVGSQVRITSGPLHGLVGTVVRRGSDDRFVATVKTLGVGASVTLRDWQVEPLVT